jgi:hypothetical protein
VVFQFQLNGSQEAIAQFPSLSLGPAYQMIKSANLNRRREINSLVSSHGNSVAIYLLSDYLNEMFDSK